MAMKRMILVVTVIAACGGGDGELGPGDFLVDAPDGSLISEYPCSSEANADIMLVSTPTTCPGFSVGADERTGIGSRDCTDPPGLVTWRGVLGCCYWDASTQPAYIYWYECQ